MLVHNNEYGFHILLWCVEVIIASQLYVVANCVSSIHYSLTLSITHTLISQHSRYTHWRAPLNATARPVHSIIDTLRSSTAETEHLEHSYHHRYREGDPRSHAALNWKSSNSLSRNPYICSHFLRSRKVMLGKTLTCSWETCTPRCVNRSRHSHSCI